MLNQEIAKTEKESFFVDGLADLGKSLEKLYSDLPEAERFERWIEEQENLDKLQDLTEKSSAVKTTFYTEDQPGVVIKRFDRGGGETWYKEERNNFPIVEKYLSKRFLPDTKFAEIKDSVNEEKKYYMLQDRIAGRHYQQATDEAIERIHQKMTIEQVKEKYVNNPSEWIKFRAEVFQEKLNDVQWRRARTEAGKLFVCLKKLEEDYRIDDLDFFVTEEGWIKIIDFQLHDIGSYKPDPDKFPIGSEEIKIFFNL